MLNFFTAKGSCKISFLLVGETCGEGRFTLPPSSPLFLAEGKGGGGLVLAGNPLRFNTRIVSNLNGE